jgi:(E)-4-hydroxy-3-methylbut-2-enyl-diphosphate synthase
VVNGIGEGKEADIGIAGGEGVGILFKKGKLVRKVPMDQLMDVLIPEVELMAKEKEAEEANGGPPQVSDRGGNDQSEWTSLPQASDRPSTLGREIPVLPNKR